MTNRATPLRKEPFPEKARGVKGKNKSGEVEVVVLLSDLVTSRFWLFSVFRCRYILESGECVAL